MAWGFLRAGTAHPRPSGCSIALPAVLAVALAFLFPLPVVLRRSCALDPADEVVRGAGERLLERRRHATLVDRRNRLLLQLLRGCECAAVVTGCELARDVVASRRELLRERPRKLGLWRCGAARRGAAARAGGCSRGPHGEGGARSVSSARASPAPGTR